MIMQGSPDWFAQRCGCITASRIADMLAGGKGLTRAKYAAQLAAERMTGKPSRAMFKSAAMHHGTDTEPFARMQYEMRNGVFVIESDFINHPYIPFSGMSPDGLVNDDGMVEFKCPDTHTFVEYLLSGDIPKNYQQQMMWQLCVSGREWCDFVAYDPDLPEEDGYIQIRYCPTQKEKTELESEVRKFSAEVDALIKSIKLRRK